MGRVALMVTSFALAFGCGDPLDSDVASPGGGPGDGGGSDGGGSDSGGGDGGTSDADADGDGWTTVDGDCDDAEPAVHPGADDGCDGVDSDCDGRVDDDGSFADYYVDGDGDGYGADSTRVSSCDGDGLVAVGGDCDDGDPAVNPAADEVSTDAVDNDCDGLAAQPGMRVTSDVPLDEWQIASTDGIDLRFLSVYEASAGDGTIGVQVGTIAPVYLVLSSYDPVQWEVTEDVAGTVVGVIASSSRSGTTISAPAGAVAEVVEGSAALGGSAYAWDDFDTRTLVQESQWRTMLSPVSFHGAYEATWFRLDSGGELSDVSAYPDCDVDRSTGPGTAADTTLVTTLSGCGGVAANTQLCLTSTGSELLALGVDDGAMCSVMAAAFGDQTLAWIGDAVYACDGDYGMLTRLSLVDGTIAKSYLYCDGVVAWDGKLVVFPHFEDPTWGEQHSLVFEDFYQAQCGAPETDLGWTRYHNSFGMVGDTLVTAWHSADTLEFRDISDVATYTSMDIDYSGYIYGVGPTDDGRIVLATDAGANAYRVVDFDDGSIVAAFAAPSVTIGMVCVAN